MIFLPILPKISKVCCIGCNFHLYTMTTKVFLKTGVIFKTTSLVLQISDVLLLKEVTVVKLLAGLFKVTRCTYIPLVNKETKIDVPESRTLFRPVQTKIYYSQDNDVQLDGTLMQ